MAIGGLPPLSAPDPIGEAAAGLFGLPYLYPAQRYVISNTLEGRNQIAVLPTGSGKSLCFQLPSQLLPGITLVLVPILSLLSDQVRRLRERRIGVGVLRGGQEPAERAKLSASLGDRSVRIVYATPEVMETSGAAEILGCARIANLVVDEAHCVCEWGESFRPAYLRIGRLIDTFRPERVTALTATASPEIIAKVRESLLGERDAILYVGNPDRPNISYEVARVLSKERAIERLARTAPRPLLVFTRSRKSAERYARLLRRRLEPAEVRFYHAGLDREERRAVEEWFRPSAGGILAATSAYGMGVDKPDIRCVVHADIPPSPEAYLQESGRAGRDGNAARAVLFHASEDDRFIEGLSDPIQRRRYEQMRSYARASSACRRATLLGFLGMQPEVCDSCDVCLGAAAGGADGESEAIAALRLQRRRFTAGEAVDFLAGRRCYQSLRLGLDRYGGYGALTGWNRDDVEAALDELCVLGSVRVIARGPWKGKVTV